MIRWGNVLFLVLILLIILISWFVKYPDVILSEAMVTTNIPPQKEYANITGKLDAILVSDNNLVVYTVFLNPLVIIYLYDFVLLELFTFQIILIS